LILALLVGGPAGAAPHFVGLNTHQPAPDLLDAAKDLGVPWVRMDFNWHQLQPQAGTIDTAFFDGLVAAAKQRGLQVFPTVGYAPAWAAEADGDGKPGNEVPKAGEYRKLCQALAAHYQGQITHWGLWNEPNLSQFFEGTRQQWIDRVLVEGIEGIRAGCPSCKVLGPELASVGTDYAVWLDDAFKQLKAKGLALDVITFHIYAGFLETKLGGWACWDGDLFEHKLDQHRTCFGWQGPLSLREVLLANSLGQLPVWITETGYTAPISDAGKCSTQVIFYRRVLEEQLERPWWQGTFFYEIVDDNLIADKWGLAVRGESSPSFPASYQLKPVWPFLKDVLASQPGFGGSGSDCGDGLDNDGDKLIDFPQDPGCASSKDPSEGVPPDAGVADAAARDGGRDGPRGDAAAADGPRGDGGATLDRARPGEPGEAGDGSAPAGCGCGLRGASEPAGLASGWLLGGLLALLLLRRAR